MNSPLKEFSFFARASDGSSSDFAQVLVRLLPKTNRPTFSQNEYTFELPEGPYGTAGATIGAVQATDQDQGPAGQITYRLLGPEKNPFFIDPVTGKIQVTGLIDRETIPRYSFQVSATNAGNPPSSSTATVNVVVLDVNDNFPKFVDPLLTISVADSTPPYTTIGSFLVLDEDAGDNGKVIYQLAGVDAQRFSIDSSNYFNSINWLANPSKLENS